MDNYLFEISPKPSLAIVGQNNRFAIRRVHCVGQNYAAHAREMGSDPTREKPFFFSKPHDAVFDAGPNQGAQVPYPPLTKDFQFEIELVVAIGKAGAGIDPKSAREHIFGFAAGIDFTRRDLQREAKSSGKPWDWGKGCDFGGPCSALRPIETIEWPQSNKIWLKQNGEIRQKASLDDLIWPIEDIVSLASGSATLMPGDLIFTGTPSGVGPVEIGDRIHGGIDGVGEVAVAISR